MCMHAFMYVPRQVGIDMHISLYVYIYIYIRQVRRGSPTFQHLHFQRERFAASAACCFHRVAAQEVSGVAIISAHWFMLPTSVIAAI